MFTHVIDGLRLKRIQNITVDIDIVIEEHDGFVPELLFGLVRIKSDKSPRGLPRVHTTQHTMILIKQVIHTAVWQIGKTLRLAQHVSGHHDSDKRFPVHPANTDTIRIVVNYLYGHGGERNQLLAALRQLIDHACPYERREAHSSQRRGFFGGIPQVSGNAHGNWHHVTVY